MSRTVGPFARKDEVAHQSYYRAASCIAAALEYGKGELENGGSITSPLLQTPLRICGYWRECYQCMIFDYVHRFSDAVEEQRNHAH